MALTKAQREILMILDQFPTAEVVEPAYRTAYLEKDGGRVKTIPFNSFNAILPYLKAKDQRGSPRYRLDPEAEITDDWPAKKRERERLGSEAKKQARLAQAATEAQKLTAWFDLTGPYSVDFSGDYFSGGGSILCNGEFVTSFSAYVSSGSTTFEAMINKPLNLTHYERIREMLRLANQSARAE